MAAEQELTQCPNGHTSMGDGQCNIAGCAYVDPSVTNNQKNPKGLDFGTARDHKVGRWAKDR